MNQEEQNLIVNAILEALTNNVEEFYNENGLRHRNAQHMLKWDYIFTNLEKNLVETPLELCSIKRGCFTFDLLVNSEHREVYSVIKLKNLNSVKIKRNFSHYMWALASINKSIKADVGQVSLFELEINEDVFNEIINVIGFVPTIYKTIVIEDSNKNFPIVALYYLDKELNEVSKEVLGQNTHVNYEFKNTNVTEQKSEIVELKLKKKSVEKVDLKVKEEKEKKKLIK